MPWHINYYNSGCVWRIGAAGILNEMRLYTNMQFNAVLELHHDTIQEIHKDAFYILIWIEVPTAKKRHVLSFRLRY